LAASGFCVLPRRRRREAVNLEFEGRGVDPRPMSHSDMGSIACGGEFSRSAKQDSCNGAAPVSGLLVCCPLWCLQRWRVTTGEDEDC
jgi:hypothetical protein